MSFFTGKRVLVTGGTGFVGRHVVAALLAQGAVVRVPVHRRPAPPGWQGTVDLAPADLTREEDCERVCRGIECLVHAAGAVGAAGTVAGDTAVAGIATNLVLTARLLQAAAQCRVDRFLLFSSSTGYPDTEHAVEEHEFWAGPPHPAYFGYGWMRRYLERLAEFTCQRSPLRIAVARPTAIYGEGDNIDPATSHVIPALIRRAVAKEDPFVVWGSPGMRRDFLHVRDLAAGCLLLLEKHAVCDPVNIGYGEAVTLDTVVNLVLQAAGHSPRVAYDPTKPSTIAVRQVDISKARRLLGFEPRIALAPGLAETVAWYTRSGGVTC